jgi:predicted transcriptional regulator
MRNVVKNPAMSFKEIAQVLGTTEKAVVNTYVRAIEKLRKNPEALQDLIELSEMRQQIVARKLVKESGYGDD